ncbi:DxFTY motif-containing membrane protein [Mycoplasma putrefaciens]|uniref:Transmembrane protein n=1 Tax=Mycoplasma putrefaciens (strain ATCC 15718 / NCTC 10155 / C30 KS-1 / KS-1) TaxID=743965 RepID=A0A7U4E9T5_MYCPK|nr:hypothetical protein [Mycoplasma putrefaciens]AEM68835.1 uncharacterized protein MPUT_0463 [Mycoplasma putrefaciens KS1]
MQTKEKQKLIEQIRFNQSRTPIWISILVQLTTVVSLFLVVLFLFGGDFQQYSWNYYDRLGKLAYLYLALICIAYLIIVVFINWILILLKVQKADAFSYCLGLAMVCVSIIYTGDLMYHWKVAVAVKSAVRFLIAIVSAVFGVIIGTLLSLLQRNKEYQIQQENEAILLAYQNHQIVPSKKQLRAIKRLKYQKQKEQEQLELIEFKNKLYKDELD